MARAALNSTDRKNIEEAVAAFVDKRHLFEAFAQGLMTNFRLDTTLSEQTHFLKYRIKDPNDLPGKLERKILEGKAKGEPFNIDRTNIFEKVNDLAGVRLIHLNTEQMRVIHPALLSVIDEQKYRVVEDHTANCWDVEYEAFYQELGIAIRSRNTMYTTVHYVVEANQKTKITCEIQVRTLADELWAEVSHRINYPEEARSRVCADQLKVLARLTTIPSHQFCKC